MKDLDVRLFYAQRDGVRKVQERGRSLVLDFGPSALNRHPDDPPDYHPTRNRPDRRGPRLAAA